MRLFDVFSYNDQLITESAVTQFASAAHEEWRRNFDPTGAKPRIKKNSDGTEGDINVPFNKLHPDWQRENLAAGQAAEQAVKKFPNDIEKAAEYIHIEWMKRNPKADYNAAQHVPYDALPEDEKEKDRVHVRTMMQLMGHRPEQGVAEGLNEFAQGSGGGESGRWYTDDQMTDIVGDGWWQDMDVSEHTFWILDSEVPKEYMIQQAQAWLDDQGYSVQVLNCRVNDDDMDWFIEGSFHNPGFAKKGVAEGILGSDPNRGQKVPGWAKGGIIGKIGRKLDPAWSDIQMTVPQHLLSKQSSVPAAKSPAAKDMPKAAAVTPTRAIPQSVGTKPSLPVTKNVVKTIADKPGVEEAAQGHTIEAHGIRGMDRRTWHKTFRNSDQMTAWAEKYDAEILGTRNLEQAQHGNLSPAEQGVDETAKLRDKRDRFKSIHKPDLVETEPTHRIGVTVTDPNHPMVGKRGETVQKSIRVKHTDRDAAIARAVAHYRRKGYKVHDHHYMGTVDQDVAEGDFGPAATAAIQQGKSPSDVAYAATKDVQNTARSLKIQQDVANGDDPTLTNAGNAARRAGNTSVEEAQGVAENDTAKDVNKFFNNVYDPVFTNLQRVALLAMQGRQQEASGQLRSVIKDADPAVQKRIIDAVNSIKPVTINGKIADSSTIDKSKQHQDWIINTFIPWVQSQLGEHSIDESNVFTDARMNAIKADQDTFVVHGKKYPVTGDTTDEKQAGFNEDWNKVNHHDRTNGLSQKAVNAYRREHPGSKLKTAVTTKPSKLKPGSKAAKRRKSFCARMSGNKGPMKKPNGKPTPKALALRRWHCESVEEMQQMIARGEQMIAEMKQQHLGEEWSQKYKNSINCSHPKGFSQKAHCAGKRKHNESIEMEMVCEDCGMCQSHGNLNEIKKGEKDSNGYTRCWPGKHAVGTKKGKNGGQVRNCKPNEGVAEGKGLAKKVKVVKGEHAGKTGWIREIKHGAFKGAPKTYYIDLDDGGQANNLPATALRLVKEQGVAEAGTSAAVRLGRAIERTQGKTAASQARSVIPSSIPKKEEPKKDEKKVDEAFSLPTMDDVKAKLLKIKAALGQEADETKQMFGTYVKHSRGQASDQEMAAANEQLKDVLRGVGMGVFALVPGHIITVPLLFGLAKKYNIQLLPSAFRSEPAPQAQPVAEGIQVGDGFIIECGDSAIETVVLGDYHDGILIEFDHTATFMLIDHGITLTEAEYQGHNVPLGKPMQGDVKKSKVYVKKPNGNVVKVNFGDKNMTIKKHLPKHRKSYRARHHCENPGPKWKANYWSCRAW